MWSWELKNFRQINPLVKMLIWRKNDDFSIKIVIVYLTTFPHCQSVEISGFFCHSDLTWTWFWSLWSPKKCHVDYLSSSEFWIFGNFWHFQVWIFSKYQNSNPPKWLKWYFLIFWNPTKFMLCKFIVAWKLLNLHIVEYPHSKMKIPN